MEIGALTVMTIGFRERELRARPLRADHRPADEPRVHPPRRRGPGPAAGRARRDPRLRRADEEAAAASTPTLLQRQPDLQGPPRRRRPPRPRRLPGARHHRPGAALDRPAAGTCARPSPYCGYETYDFEVTDLGHLRRLRPVPDPARRDVRVAKIVEQAADRLAGLEGAPVMVADKKIAWPGQLAIGSDGMGNSLDHIRAHHGRVDGGADPPLQAGHRGLPGPGRARPTSPIESPRGELGCARRLRRRHPPVPGALPRPVASPTCRPWPRCARAAMVADVIVAVASIDPVMGGVDR